KADDYEENRHFLLAQYFRNNYNAAMRDLPVVNSQVEILRMEVWVTNRNGSTTDTRDVVALMDLGEQNPYNPGVLSLTSNSLPDNNANDLYARLTNDPTNRNPVLVQGRLNAMGLKPVEDFEKTFARKLRPDEYYFNPKIGFLSLNQQLREDEVLGVAFQYSYNGRIITVGEFSQDVPPDTTSALPGTQKVLFLKLLKATSQRTYLPLWDLMMKNVYSVGAYNLQREDFKLNILYQEPSLGEKRYLPEGNQAGVPLLTVLNLDRLNNQNDPQPDGVFDYVEGYTVLTQYSRIIFPLIEPFGRDLDSIAFANSPQDLKDKYVFYPLYDTIKSIAQTYANLNRYVMRGTAKSGGGSSSEISLNAFNVPPGSVTITAGGQLLKENIDYIIDYSLGTVRIINQSILNANIPVDVQFENNAGFGLQQRNYMGLRLDYLASDKLSIGASMVKLGERPFFTKMLYNEDPIRNTMYGVDFNYTSEFPRLTRWLDKLPLITTNAPSSISAYGEAAFLKPGHPPQIGKGSGGLIYIDDFEGTRNSIDLRFPLNGWALASTPQGNGLFPESELVNDLNNGINRAKLAWYNIEPTLQDRRALTNPLKGDLDELSKPETRAVNSSEIFPQRTPDLGQNQLVTFDLAFFPRERGPYNFDTRPGFIDAEGRFLNPRNRWGGLMRALDQIDFETGNVEFIEFWVQDPFINRPGSSGGKLYFNLGNISEDILRDSRRQFENGLSTPNIPSPSDNSTVWGKVPANPIQVTNAFSNDPNDRAYQDVGLDGLTDEEEAIKFIEYLEALRTNFGANSKVYLDALNDPANDNFRNYRDAEYDKTNTGILGRYARINMPQGNSPLADVNDQFTSAFTLYPDQEDLNRDNTLNELEEYFQYEVEMRPNMQVGSNFITDKRTVDVKLQNGSTRTETWYQFRIPIAEYNLKVGNIPDFKSIRFIRMFLTDFEDTVVLRFAKLDLVRNQWRRFSYQLDTAGRQIQIDPNSPTTLNTLAVNLEENDRRQPVPYRIPPGIERVQQLSNNNVNILQNEQALSLQICNLAEGEARGVFKTMNLDLRQYGRLSMFIHAESVIGQPAVKDNELYAVVRLGTDFIHNYYEIKVPLKITLPGQSIDSLVWPIENNLDFDLEILTRLKVERNNNGSPLIYYSREIDGKRFAIYGNPNLGEVRSMFIGVENRDDGGLPVCTEVWFNELRLSSINERGGYAAVGRVDITLADLGTISASINAKSSGFGSLEQRVNERSRENFSQIDFAANLELAKLLPRRWGMSVPFYASYTRSMSTPEYDPYDLDIRYKDKINSASAADRDSIRNDAVDVSTIKTINFTNVRKNNISGKELKVWSIENFDL
ncbi:MAG TPA: cell surface protein SprA, partial [Parasegetibacter sp.]